MPDEYHLIIYLHLLKKYSYIIDDELMPYFISTQRKPKAGTCVELLLRKKCLQTLCYYVTFLISCVTGYRHSFNAL